MSKVFEDYFTELQADMVHICLEYVEGMADIIYIYCSYEINMLASDVFYCINGQIVEKHKLNECNGNINYDVSSDRQKALLRILNEDFKEIENICKKFEQPMPTEIKIIYDVKKNSMEAKYKYDVVYSNDEYALPEHIFIKWFEEIKKSL